MDIFEVSVYLLIIVVASVCVFGIMWLLMRSMTPRRALTKKEIEILKASGVKKIPKAVPIKAAKRVKAKVRIKTKIRMASCLS